MTEQIRTLLQGPWSDAFRNKDNQGFGYHACGIVNTDGTDVDVNHPLPTDGDSVYPKDINVDLSDIGTFLDGVGDILYLFKDIPITLNDNSSTNPKYLEFTLLRPIEATQIAMGCPSGNFSNVSISLLDLSGVERGTAGDSTDSTKRTSFEYDIINSADASKAVKFGAVRIEFHTADPVCLGFVYIQKEIRTVSRIQGLDQDGVNRSARVTEAGNLRVADFLTEVSRGNIPGYSLDRKFGSVDSISAGTPSDVWSYGTVEPVYTFSTTADIDRISSSDSGDTGIEITVVGLDTNGDEVIQTVGLDETNSQTPVALDTTLWRVNRAFNANGTELAGDVYVFVNGPTSSGVPDDTTTVRAFIPVGEGQTLQTIYTVPNGKTAFFMGLETSLKKAGNATITAGRCVGRTREFGKVFRTVDDFELVSHGTSNRVYNFPIPLPFPGRTDFISNVDVTFNGVGATWAFTVLLIDD